MIKSMTGYGRHEALIEGRNILIEIKSVNHRYFEFYSRVSKGYNFLDEKLKSYIQNRVSRGKIDIFVTIDNYIDEDVHIVVNHSLAKGYVEALKELKDTYALLDDISVSSVAKYTDIFTVQKPLVDEEKLWESVESVLNVAVDKFIDMREIEGQKLKDDIEDRAKKIISMVEKIESRSPKTVIEYQNKLKLRLSELLNDTKVDEQRLLTEAAIFADKASVAEETVRLKSHFAQLIEVLNSNNSVGRKLDFIVQEMNREINTIGAKACDSYIARIVVDVKAEIEKIREQVQNIE